MILGNVISSRRPYNAVHQSCTQVSFNDKNLSVEIKCDDFTVNNLLTCTLAIVLIVSLLVIDSSLVILSLPAVKISHGHMSAEWVKQYNSPVILLNLLNMVHPCPLCHLQ